MQGLDTTIVNTALPAMAASLNEDPLQMHTWWWPMCLPLLPVFPWWLARRPFWGAQYLFQCHYHFLPLASLGCGFSESLNELLFYRVLQGIGGALLLPVGRLAMLKSHSRGRSFYRP